MDDLQQTLDEAIVRPAGWRQRASDLRLSLPHRRTRGQRHDAPVHGCSLTTQTPRLRDRSLFLDAHRGDGKRFVAQADEKLTAFLELESATRVAEN
jgi:hypothetical protein